MHLVLECIKDAYIHLRAKASAQVVLTKDKRKNVYQNLHTSIPRTIKKISRYGNWRHYRRWRNSWQIHTTGLLLITNGVLPEEIFPITTRNVPRKLNANSLVNRERNFKSFIQHCATYGLKYEYIDVHFSHKDEHSLETNELIKRNGYTQAFFDFAEKAKDPTCSYNHTHQRMKRINHHMGGVPKVTPFGVIIYGILSKDAQKMLVKLSEIGFPQTVICLSYLSARQQWIDW